MYSKFQFKGHHVAKISVLNVHPETDATSLNYFANYRYDYEDQQWRGEIALGFKLCMESQNANNPTLFEIIIIGQFVSSDEQTPEAEQEFEKRLQINGATTLIPIARAALVSARALMNCDEPYNIPNINVFKLTWKCLNEAGQPDPS